MKDNQAKQQTMGKAAASTFITGTDSGTFKEEEIVFKNTDVKRAAQWKAHADAINWVTWTG